MAIFIYAILIICNINKFSYGKIDSMNSNGIRQKLLTENQSLINQSILSEQNIDQNTNTNTNNNNNHHQLPNHNHNNLPNNNIEFEDNDKKRIKRNNDRGFIRLGKNNLKTSFLRFGKSQNKNFIRLGRTNGQDTNDQSFIRFGRAPQNHIDKHFLRFGRIPSSSGSSSGSGSSSNGNQNIDNNNGLLSNTEPMKFGRRGDKFIRFGRNDKQLSMIFNNEQQLNNNNNNNDTTDNIDLMEINNNNNKDIIDSLMSNNGGGGGDDGTTTVGGRVILIDDNIGNGNGNEQRNNNENNNQIVEDSEDAIDDNDDEDDDQRNNDNTITNLPFPMDNNKFIRFGRSSSSSGFIRLGKRIFLLHKKNEEYEKNKTPGIGRKRSAIARATTISSDAIPAGQSFYEKLKLFPLQNSVIEKQLLLNDHLHHNNNNNDDLLILPMQQHQQRPFADRQIMRSQLILPLKNFIGFDKNDSENDILNYKLLHSNRYIDNELLANNLD